ncbi:MAG: hypothetical protein WC460_04025 [Patescibacteria group bacterium]
MPIDFNNPDDVKKFMEEKADKDDINKLAVDLEQRFDKKTRDLIYAVGIVLLVMTISILCSLWIDYKNSTRPEWELVNKLTEIKTEQNLLRSDFENLNKKVKDLENYYIIPSK